MQENFYIKKVYYGAYVKNIVLPMSAILNNKRNEVGIKLSNTIHRKII
ncbi:hypothetical protein [Spiroplasma endosymbiont of Phycita roborella]